MLSDGWSGQFSAGAAETVGAAADVVTTAPIIRISFEFVQGTGGRQRQPGQGYLPILEIEGSEEVFGGVSYRFLDPSGDPLSENVDIPVEGSADVSALNGVFPQLLSPKIP